MNLKTFALSLSLLFSANVFAANSQLDALSSAYEAAFKSPDTFKKGSYKYQDWDKALNALKSYIDGLKDKDLSKALQSLEPLSATLTNGMKTFVNYGTNPGNLKDLQTDTKNAQAALKKVSFYRSEKKAARDTLMRLGDFIVEAATALENRVEISVNLAKLKAAHELDRLTFLMEGKARQTGSEANKVPKAEQAAKEIEERLAKFTEDFAKRRLDMIRQVEQKQGLRDEQKKELQAKIGELDDNLKAWGAGIRQWWSSTDYAAEKASAEQELGKIEERIKQAEAIITQHLDKIRTMDADKASLQAALEEATTKIGAAKQELKEKLESLSTDADSLIKAYEEQTKLLDCPAFKNSPKGLAECRASAFSKISAAAKKAQIKVCEITAQSKDPQIEACALAVGQKYLP